MKTKYRALSFGEPAGPWRTCEFRAREDLIERELGSYDEWGRFFVTVPGDMEIVTTRYQSSAA